MKIFMAIIFLFGSVASLAQKKSIKEKKQKMIEWVELINTVLTTNIDSCIEVPDYANSLHKLTWPFRPKRKKIKHIFQLQTLLCEYNNVLKKDTAKLEEQKSNSISVLGKKVELLTIAADTTTAKTIVDTPKRGPVVPKGKTDPLSENIARIIDGQQKANKELMEKVFRDHSEVQTKLFADVKSVLESMKALNAAFIKATHVVQQNQRAIIQLSLEQEQRAYRLELLNTVAQVRTDFRRYIK